MISFEMRAGIAAMIAAIAVPAHAWPIVVRSTGPSAVSYKPGQQLAKSATLVLRAGDQVTVLDSIGTRTFTGPGNFRFDRPSASAAAPAAFTELLTQKTERRARIGAVRGGTAAPDGAPVPPGVWAIDSGASGTVCAIDPTKLALWRADPVAAANLKLTRIGDGRIATAAFPAGQAIALWPTTLAAAPGDVFRISGGGGVQTITLVKLAAAPAAIDELGVAFLESGCTAQFERLAAVTKVTEPAP